MNTAQTEKPKERQVSFGLDSFSQLSEQGTKELEIQVQPEDELSWKAFHKQRLQIQNLLVELLPLYTSHRKNLVETAKEITIEMNKNDNIHLPQLFQQQQRLQKIQYLKRQSKESDADDKKAIIEKIISERRIKRYYKNKHQINFQDELDPEDDQQQIYKFYEEMFGDQNIQYHEPHPMPPSPRSQVHPNQYQIQQHQPQLYRPQQTFHPANSLDRTDSFPAFVVQNKSNINKQKLNYIKANEASLGFQPDLSFDFHHQHHFIQNNYNLQSFAGLGVEDDHYDVLSEGGKALKNRQEKQDDQLSLQDNYYRNFIQKQNQELKRQRERVQELANQAYRVLNNDGLEEQANKHEQHSEEDDRISKLRYLLGELIDLYSVVQCLKFHLKFKSYDMLNKLYEHASEYYGETIIFEQPLQVKYITQIVGATLPEQDEQGIRIIIFNIFGTNSSMSYEQFLQRFTTSINDKQFKLLEESIFDAHSYKTLDLSIRLFNIWIEIHYFETQIKKIFQSDAHMTDKFIGYVTEAGQITSNAFCEFLSKTKKTKLKKLKVQIFLKNILGEKMNLSQFYRWIDQHKQKVNATFQKQRQQQKLQYFYNLY